MAGTKTSKKQISQYLLDAGVIDQDTLRQALDEQRKTGQYLREVFLRMGVDEGAILKFFEDELEIPGIKLSDYEIDSAIIQLVPERLVRRYKVVPLFRIRDSLTLAMEDPLNVLAIDEVSSVTGLDIESAAATRSDISAAIKRYYGTETRLDIFGDAAGGRGDVEIDRQIVEFVELMVKQALEDKASDIHVEPEEDCTRVRFRVDGMLREVTRQPAFVHSAICSRIKVLADLDIAERRLPQDGRIQMDVDGFDIDLRISTFPTIHGENVVIRLLDKRNAILSIAKLGMSNRDGEVFSRLVAKPNGIVLVTGPTGSGKTTTLYAALQTINKPDVNIQTLEDPVEYILPGIRQTQVNEEIGLSFARGLRALVRQDPDVIMLGEIRDQESAEIAVRSSLTGHLVLSTLHTNDAVGVLARLQDMGIDSFLVASSLLGVVAQRLVRRLCGECRVETPLPDSAVASLGSGVELSGPWYSGEGCAKCGQSGYAGRVGIHEVLEITQEVRGAIMREEPLDTIRDLARQAGMDSLRESALAKARQGLTSIEEVLRVTKLDNRFDEDEQDS